MKQIAIFKTDAEGVKLANEFLAKTPPEQVIIMDNGQIAVNYDDQSYPDTYIAEELNGLILSNRKEIMTNEVSIETMQYDLQKREAELKNLEENKVEILSKDMPNQTKEEKEAKKQQEQLEITENAKRGERIGELLVQISNIKNGIDKMVDSNKRCEFKISSLQKKLNALNLQK